MRHALTTLLLLPAVALAQPSTLCTREHAARAGHPAPCTGVLSPPQTALDGAECVDALLPRCEALRGRQSAVCRAEALSLSRMVSESDARAARWRELARVPCPAPVTRIVERPVGVPTWVAWAVLAAGVAGGVWVGRELAGWKVAR